jgi:hypothetical protein
MAVIRDVIGFVDDIKPNAFGDEVKVGWLSSVEGRVMADVLLLAQGEFVLPFVCPGDLGVRLLVSSPHDDLYGFWLLAQVDFANGEFDRYANSYAMFNAAWDNFARWFGSTYAPAQGYDLSLRRAIPLVW